MAQQTEAEIRQMLKAIDAIAPDPRTRPVLLFTVTNLVATKWALEKIDPAFREKQAVDGGLFGKPVAVKPVSIDPVSTDTVEGTK